MSADLSVIQTDEMELLTTFYVGRDLFGIEVLRVQEVTGAPLIIPVALAPDFVTGLINLRGQLATALGLRELFGITENKSSEQMSVVCRTEGHLISLIVDEIGDVIQTDIQNYEAPPDTMPTGVKRFVKSIYKMNNKLLSILDLDKLSKELSPTTDESAN